MITKDQIDKFYKDVESLSLKFPGASISKATGFSKGTVSSYLNRKEEPSESFLKAFYKEFGKGLGSSPEEKVDVTTQALLNLTESNKVLAESNRTLADSHSRLVTMVESGSTADVLKETGLNDSSTILDLLVVLADVGVHAGKWHSKEEAYAELHRIGVEFATKKKVKGTRDGVGK